MTRRFSKPTLTFLAILLATSLLGACASTGGGAPAGPPPEEQIEALVMDVLAMLQEGNIDGVIAKYSDDFTWDNGDRASMEAFLQGAADGGFLDGMTANTDEMAVAVDGDDATVSGVTIEGAFGLLDLTFDVANRDGQWVVTKQSQQ